MGIFKLLDSQARNYSAQFGAIRRNKCAIL